MRQTAVGPHVLHVNTARSWRGGEQQMVYLLRGLRERGLRAEAVCQPRSPAAARARAAGALVHELPMRGELDLSAALEIARLVRHGRFDILHAHTSHAHALGWLAKSRPGAALSASGISSTAWASTPTSPSATA